MGECELHKRCGRWMERPSERGEAQQPLAQVEGSTQAETRRKVNAPPLMLTCKKLFQKSVKNHKSSLRLAVVVGAGGCWCDE